MDELTSRNWLTKEEAESFTGTNGYYYLEKWRNHSNAFFKGWNWAAALFRVEWMVYRKMYLETSIALLFLVASAVFLSADDPVVPVEITTLAVHLLAGFLGNGLYRMKAMRVFKKTRHMDEQQRLGHLGKKGGTSLVGLFVLLGAEFAFLFLLPILLDSITIGH